MNYQNRLDLHQELLNGLDSLVSRKNHQHSHPLHDSDIHTCLLRFLITMTEGRSFKTEDSCDEFGDMDQQRLWEVFTSYTFTWAFCHDSQAESTEVTKEVVQKWRELSPKEKASLSFRTHMLQDICKDPPLHLGFWIYYYQQFSDNCEFEPHASISSADAFFKNVLNQWNVLKREDCKAFRGRGVALGLKFSLPPVSHSEIAVSPTDITSNPTKPAAGYLTQNAFSECSLQQLEEKHGHCNHLLERLKATLQDHFQADTSNWARQIEKLGGQFQHPKTIIGIIGATGVGKSAIINAILDEEKLVPTSSWGACTAVATEISYNDKSGPSYRAEVQFVSKEDWHYELQLMFSDIFNGSGQISQDASDKSSDASVAFAKINAVYPNLGKEELLNTTIDDLMRHQSAASLLGKTQNLTAHTALELYRDLQDYVDSKKRYKQGMSGIFKGSSSTTMWPLIRVVRIYAPAALLRGGIVIVDLPGIADSNKARSAVASEYLKQCSYLWVVAPIIRAIDDKSARDLQGEAFKRQLAIDGSFNTVTFICSKSDDIGMGEIQESLGIDPRAFEAQKSQVSLKVQKLKDEIAEKRSKVSELDAEIGQLEDMKRTYLRLKVQIERGKKVYKPSIKRKRKCESKASSTRKKRRTQRGERIDQSQESDLDADRERVELTLEVARDKISALEEKIDDLGENANDLETQTEQLQKELQVTENDLSKTDGEMWRFCVKQRNASSREVIQQDFAAGIRELDKELACEANPHSFDPDVEIRDYEQLKKSLPVFCVSSKGYQRLKGHFRKEKIIDQFESFDETEIPALQKHCQKLAEDASKIAHRHFVNDVDLLTTSIRLWATGDDFGKNLTNDEVEAENVLLRKQLKGLQTEMVEAGKLAITSIANDMRRNILDVFPVAAGHARDKAQSTTTKWGQSVDKNNNSGGGFSCQTYRAIVRRQGYFKKGKSTVDFNDQLSAPMTKALTLGWMRTFKTHVPAALKTASQTCNDALQRFHATVEKRALDLGSRSAVLDLVHEQLQKYKDRLDDTFNELKIDIVFKQKEANRAFVPAIQSQMKKAYKEAGEEKGTGCFIRIKRIMEDAVSTAKDFMFEKATSKVQKRLLSIMTEGEGSLLNTITNVCGDVERDYAAIFSRQGGKLSQEERHLQLKVLEVLDDAGKFLHHDESQIVKDAASSITEKNESCSRQPLETGLVDFKVETY